MTNAIKENHHKETSSKMFQKLAQNVPGVIYQVEMYPNKNPKFIYVSMGSIDVFGLTAEEIQSDYSNIFKRIPPDDYEKLIEARTKSISDLLQFDINIRFIVPKKGIRWINLKSTPEKFENKTIWHGYAQDITEQKEKELSLIESEEKYRSIIENSLNGFLVSNNQGILDANLAAANIFGYDTLEEFKLKSSHEIFDVNEASFIKMDEERNLSGKVRAEVLGIKKSGERFPIELYSVLRYNTKNERSTITFLIDISERKKNEENLLKSQNLLKQAESIAQIGSSEIDYKTGKFYWSDEFYRIHGLEPQSVDPTPEFSDSFLHPDEKYKIALFDEAPLKKIEHLEFNTKIFRADNELRELSTFWRITYDKDGQPLKMYGVVQDITEKKQLENALKVSELKFRSAFELAGFGIALVKPDGNWVDINESLCNMFGYKKEELLKISFKDITHPDDLEEDLIQLSKLQKGEIDRFKMNKRYYHKDGTIVWGLLVVSTMKDEFGKTAYFIAHIENITDQKLAEQQLITLNQQLELKAKELTESNIELEQFAYVASHDLQEPLRMVSSFLQLIEKHYAHQLDSKAIEYINYAVDGAKRMKRLILDLLDLSRVNTNAKEFEEVNLNTTLKEAINNLTTIIDSTEATVIFVDLPTIMGIKSQFYQLLQNLIGNALKYKCVDRKPIINITCIDNRNTWEIKITDNGIGIAPEFYDRIFVIFQRLHNSNQYSGTGIGLAICKKIVEKHGGKIWVESVVGKGSSFCFTVPKK